jgi:hypothetical protein
MIITLCGSTRFRKEFDEWNAKLTLQGHAVFSLGLFGKQGSDVGKPAENTPITDEQKVILDKVHKRKIGASDAIVVLNVGGYIGESTRSEIEFANLRDVDIYYLEKAPDWWWRADQLLDRNPV